MPPKKNTARKSRAKKDTLTGWVRGLPRTIDAARCAVRDRPVACSGADDGDRAHACP
jgi:hypothetical protein